MPCTAPLLAELDQWMDPDTGALERQLRLLGVYTDAKAAWYAGIPPSKAVTTKQLRLPCGKCLDCQSRHKLHWVHRCTLEAQEHSKITFATMTYEEAPLTLSVRDLQLFHKRLRKELAKQHNPDGTPRRYKHFSCGEYGETNGRPHYHAILFGVDAARDEEAIHKAWGLGFTTAEPAGPGAIAYVAGYVNKKKELICSDDDTWQNPFIRMSRGGRNGTGIAAEARKHRQSWRDYAVLNGRQIGVPRYLHNAWKKDATEQELETLELSRENYRRIHGDDTDTTRAARALATQTRINNTRQQRKDKNTL